MITVENEKCTACGLCAQICHEQCIVVSNGSHDPVVHIDHPLCSTCTQCIAICPRRALSWEHVTPVAYDRDRLPQPAQVAELLKERRTVRKFKARKLERLLLAEIVGYAACAPTNNYALRAIVVDDPAIILALDAIIMRYSSWIYTLCFRYRPLFALLRRLSPSVSHKQKVKMKRGLERGHSFDTAPAAQVYIVGDRRVLLSEISAHYALYSMILYAQANGVGSRIKSAGPLVLDRNRTARRWLGLQAREHILATLDLGYPAVRFSNKVEGKYLPLTWNGRQPND